MITKVCPRCKKDKTATEYYTCSNRSDGLHFWCKECDKDYAKKNLIAYRQEHKEEIAQRNSKYQTEHKLSCNARKKKWAASNKEKVREINRKYRINHPERKSDIAIVLRKRIGTLIRYSLGCGKNGSSWELLVGYKMDDLREHLENSFQDGMSWENISEWHIDHIVPVSAFNFNSTKDIDFKRCWELSNLRPMWAKDNQSKGNKLYKPFQPALRMTV